MDILQSAIARATILVVDDTPDNLVFMSGLLKEHFRVKVANNGVKAISIAQSSKPPDLILLDIMMPEMDGYEVCHRLKADPLTEDIPIIFLTAKTEMEDERQGLELGAVDYITKPVSPPILMARVNTQLMLKAASDFLREKNLELQREIRSRQVVQEALKVEQQKSERLVLSILPKAIAERLKRSAGKIAEQFDNVTILFADIVGFTPLSSQISPLELVSLLNDIFSTFDSLAEKFGVEKIKTIGDAYMAVCGVPIARPDHVESVMEMAIAMTQEVSKFTIPNGQPVQLRIGINTGTVVAGVIGTNKFSYDLWGDTVNLASRMESHGIAGRIQVTEACYQQLKDKYNFEKWEQVNVKGRGQMTTYLFAR